MRWLIFTVLVLPLATLPAAACDAPAAAPTVTPPAETTPTAPTTPISTTTTPTSETPAPPATETAVPPEEIQQDGYRIIKDVVYGQGGGIPLKLDIYIPDKTIACPTPAVVFIHGGGWRQGDKYPSRVSALAKAGFFCVSINYRLSGVAPFPAAVEDAKCAVRWVRAHAEEYNVDADNIGVWGGSAGGHLSLMVGLADGSLGMEGTGGWNEYSSRVRAVCSYYGPTDLTLMPSRDTAASTFLGGTPEELPEAYRLASPLKLVTLDDAPVMMVHGNADVVVPLEQSELLLQAYQAKGMEAELIVVDNAGHGFKPVDGKTISPSVPEIEQQVIDFFIKYLIYGHHG